MAKRRGLEVVEGHLMSDHVHMCLSIPPKEAVSSAVGYMKGKSAIMITRHFKGNQRNFRGENFWACGYFVSTIGLDEDMVRQSIRDQEKHDAHFEQMRFEF